MLKTQLVSLILVVAVTQQANGEVLHINKLSSISCKNLHACAWKTSNTELYNNAYEWTHHNTITNWSYKPIDTFDSQDCVFVSYSAPVQVPKFIRKYAFNPYLQTNIKKTVCVKDDVLIETVYVNGVTLVSNVNIQMRAQIWQHEDKVQYESTINFDIPWYLSLLSNQITTHIERSILEYMDMLTRNVEQP